jgi:predicted TIM-barrel fold metal-dependent hydrolase
MAFVAAVAHLGPDSRNHANQFEELQAMEALATMGLWAWPSGATRLKAYTGGGVTAMLTIDADAHVLETERTWDYLDPDDRKYRPVLVAPEGKADRQHWLVEGKIRGIRFPTLTEQELAERSRVTGRNLQTPRAAGEMEDVELRLRHMDELGIDIQVLHNTIFIEQLTDRPEVDVALCRAWNRWLAEICRQGKGRLRWSAVPPLLSVPDALAEIRSAKENGAVAVLMRPLEGNRLLLDPYFYPIYEEAERLDLAIAIHIANANPWLCDILRSPYDTAAPFALFRGPTVMACMALIMSEVPQVFPRLRWGFIEASAQWIPWIAHEARNRYQSQGREVPENFFDHSHIYVTCQIDDDLPYILTYAGDDHIVIGTDYGHLDASTDVDAITLFKQTSSVPPAVVERILYDNPKALYGLDV